MAEESLKSLQEAVGRTPNISVSRSRTGDLTVSERLPGTQETRVYSVYLSRDKPDQAKPDVGISVRSDQQEPHQDKTAEQLYHTYLTVTPLDEEGVRVRIRGRFIEPEAVLQAIRNGFEIFDAFLRSDSQGQAHFYSRAYDHMGASDETGDDLRQLGINVDAIVGSPDAHTNPTPHQSFGYMRGILTKRIKDVVVAK